MLKGAQTIKNGRLLCHFTAALTYIQTITSWSSSMKRINKVVDKRIDNNLNITLELLAPYKEQLKAVAVESTFNWYWLVGGLMEQGYQIQLVNTAAVKQYDGLKYSGDHQDAFHLAHLMRLGILPTGHIYPTEYRQIRDLLRRRRQLVKHASSHIISIQN
tara:strand:- start:6813 stop:7292 length:480 start_codon:yes stop_codon:yes gene_type:complete